MEQQQAQQTGGATPAESKDRWVRPEFGRFAAGGAEAADINQSDGNGSS